MTLKTPDLDLVKGTITDSTASEAVLELQAGDC